MCWCHVDFYPLRILKSRNPQGCKLLFLVLFAALQPYTPVQQGYDLKGLIAAFGFIFSTWALHPPFSKGVKGDVNKHCWYYLQHFSLTPLFSGGVISKASLQHLVLFTALGPFTPPSARGVKGDVNKLNVESNGSGLEDQ